MNRELQAATPLLSPCDLFLPALPVLAGAVTVFLKIQTTLEHPLTPYSSLLPELEQTSAEEVISEVVNIIKPKRGVFKQNIFVNTGTKKKNILCLASAHHKLFFLF